MNHPPGSVAWQWDATTSDAYNCEFETTSQTVNGTETDVIVRDANMVPQCKKDASRAAGAVSRRAIRGTIRAEIS